jgi:hypothetical protein
MTSSRKKWRVPHYSVGQLCQKSNASLPAPLPPAAHASVGVCFRGPSRCSWPLPSISAVVSTVARDSSGGRCSGSMCSFRRSRFSPYLPDQQCATRRSAEKRDQLAIPFKAQRLLREAELTDCCLADGEQATSRSATSGCARNQQIHETRTARCPSGLRTTRLAGMRPPCAGTCCVHGCITGECHVTIPPRYHAPDKLACKINCT